MADHQSFKYEVFFSYASHDVEAVRKLARRLREDYGISSFVADDDLKVDSLGGNEWIEILFDTLSQCRFFVIFVSPVTRRSTYVSSEIKHFHEKAFLRDPRRRMFVLAEKSAREDDIHDELKGFYRPKDENQLLTTIASHLIKSLKDTREEVEKLESELIAQKENANKKVQEAFEHYGQTRFWTPLSRHQHLHIFTCGRDALPDPLRGDGGRTNIDRWDYQTVLQITHFFSENFPGTRVTIENPVAKLSKSDLENTNAGERVADLMLQMRDKDCVIIGSPDVSDFAEIVLARLHKTQAFAHGVNTGNGSDPLKRKGFTLIKEAMKAPSSTYRLRLGEEGVGVEWVEKGMRFTVSANNTYGILVVCRNPFSSEGKAHKIVIFSGFTGVATYGMSTLLTSRAPEDLFWEFFQIDQKFGSLDTNFEALIGVHFVSDDDGTQGGDRRPGDRRRLRPDRPVTVEAMVEIPDWARVHSGRESTAAHGRTGV